MKLIKLTRGLFTKVDDEDYEYLNQFKWYADICGKDFYASRTLKKIKMHRVIMNCPKDKVVDHKFGDTLDNQKVNLRICTKKQNTQNRSKQEGNYTSKYMGVYKYTSKYTSKWKSEITVNNKKKSLGYFNTEVEAAEAFNAAVLVHRGEFAKLNILTI